MIDGAFPTLIRKEIRESPGMLRDLFEWPHTVGTIEPQGRIPSISREDLNKFGTGRPPCSYFRGPAMLSVGQRGRLFIAPMLVS